MLPSMFFIIRMFLWDWNDGNAFYLLLVCGIHADDDETMPPEVNMLVSGWYMTKPFDNKSADRVRFHIAKIFMQSFFDEFSACHAADDAYAFFIDVDFIIRLVVA